MLDARDTQAARLAQEAERKRIARELHDGVVQTLTALVADLEYFRSRSLDPTGRDGRFAEKVETWQDLARASLDSMRQVLAGLRASDLLDSGPGQRYDLCYLPGAIEALLARMQSAGYRVEFEYEDWPVMLPADYTSNLYAIVREALTNISKHAHATMVSVSLFCFESRLHLCIADNGVGMDCTAAAGGPGYQQGLIGMRERAALLGGLITMESDPASGTLIEVDIPRPGVLPG